MGLIAGNKYQDKWCSFDVPRKVRNPDKADLTIRKLPPTRTECTKLRKPRKSYEKHFGLKSTQRMSAMFLAVQVHSTPRGADILSRIFDMSRPTPVGSFVSSTKSGQVWGHTPEQRSPRPPRDGTPSGHRPDRRQAHHVRILQKGVHLTQI